MYANYQMSSGLDSKNISTVLNMNENKFDFMSSNINNNEIYLPNAQNPYLNNNINMGYQQNMMLMPNPILNNLNQRIYPDIKEETDDNNNNNINNNINANNYMNYQGNYQYGNNPKYYNNNYGNNNNNNQK